MLLKVAEELNNLDEEFDSMSNGFNKAGFMNWLKEEFAGVIDSHWNYDLVENILDYALRDEVSKDQFAYFVSDILPEVEFLEVAKFCDTKYLTDGTRMQLEQLK